MAVAVTVTVVFGLIMILLIVVWAAELQTTVNIVLDRGGLWLSYSTGVGRWRFTGIQIRMMSGHAPRAWMRPYFSRHIVPADFHETVSSSSSDQWKPLQLPIKSALDIGVKLLIRELSVKAIIGVDGDAAATAMLCGILSSMLEVLRAVSTRGQFVPRGIVEVKPSFQRARLSIRIKCILAIKARHIIREVIENLSARRKQDGQSSD